MEEDRISQLPDDILLLILDKIDTSKAVKTSILSKRWKNLRYLLPSLRLRFRLSGPRFHSEELRSKLLSLSQRVSQYLSHRDATATIHDFHLSFHIVNILLCGGSGIDSEFMEKCVLYAINHGVQSLRLDAPTYLEFRFPAAFFSCKTLRELELRNMRISVKVGGRLSLPNLKTLLLQTSALVSDDVDISVEPFSGLPELEKLTLIKYSLIGLVIKAPKLRVLKIIDYHAVEEISAPLLASFRYDNYKAWECAKVDLPMLEQVHLDIQSTRYDFNHVHTDFVRMLHQFRNATTVSLTSNTLKVLERNGGPFEQTPPHPFPSMKCLKVIRRLYGIRKVSKGVIDYLMGTLCCELELSPRVFVVEQTCFPPRAFVVEQTCEEHEDYERYGNSYSYHDDSD